MITDEEFWKRVKYAAQELGIADTNYRQWKSRGVLPGRYSLPIYAELHGTDLQMKAKDIIKRL